MVIVMVGLSLSTKSDFKSGTDTVHLGLRLQSTLHDMRRAGYAICNMQGYATICKRSAHAEIEAECSSSTCKGRKMGWIVDDNGFEDLC